MMGLARWQIALPLLHIGQHFSQCVSGLRLLNSASFAPTKYVLLLKKGTLPFYSRAHLTIQQRVASPLPAAGSAEGGSTIFYG